MRTRKRDVLLYCLKGLIVGSICLYLIFNIIASQLVPSGYFAFVREDKTAVIELLKAVKLQPEFSSIIDVQRGIFGQSIDQELFAEEQRRDDRVRELEHTLQYNIKARDILYALSVLYNEKGDTARAHEYLERARAVDPLIGK